MCLMMLTICDESLLEFNGISSFGGWFCVAWRQFDSYYYCYYYYDLFILRIRYTSALPQILMIYRASARIFFSYTTRSPLATSSSDLFIAFAFFHFSRGRAVYHVTLLLPKMQKLKLHEKTNSREISETATEPGTSRRSAST